MFQVLHKGCDLFQVLPKETISIWFIAKNQPESISETQSIIYLFFSSKS